MKILETKNWKDSFKEVFTCKHCETVFEVDLSDVKYRLQRCNGSNWNWFYVDCPTCERDPDSKIVSRITIDDEFDEKYHGDKPRLSPYQHFVVMKQLTNTVKVPIGTESLISSNV